MSHKATNWLAELDPQQVSNSEFRILFVLCDCHNPAKGCFPKQAYISDRAGRGASSVNAALTGLEEKGLIRRIRRHNSKTKQRESTHYTLGFEFGTPQEPTPNSGDGAISGFSAEPSSVSSQSQLLKTGVTIKEEPVNEPVMNQVCSAGADPQTKTVFSETGEVADAFDEFREAHPRLVDIQKTRAAFFAAVVAGTSPTEIVAGAHSYAKEQEGSDPKFVKSSALWLKDKRWADHKPKRSGKEGSREDTARFWAGIILTDGFVPDNAINTGMRADIIALRLMTDQQLTGRGFA
ncbi:helix-turn-helix domain-containing protein [Candidatus Halocynthiibacter alkanivorans]|uniref:helix-turn-helix domain-containing protein n=1 Tax=Candidatus Halocynthiibacter alkanivorans TaxID=2267619 RepID=UPI00135B510C|nr:helix-turn-helix domain-containing protein [Candidatus Halocynthiibacter alkanivorans]